MKKVLILMVAVVASAALCTSCLNNDLADYPSLKQLNGVFGHADVKGYRAIFVIKDSSAYFASFDPRNQLDCEVAGILRYDQSRGLGAVSNGDTTVLVSTLRGISDVFGSVSYKVNEKDTIKFLDGRFGRLLSASLPLGKWTNTVKESETFGSILELTKLVGSDCGILAIRTGEEVDSAVVTGVTDFYLLSTGEMMGSFSYQFEENPERIATGFYNSKTRSMELIDHQGDFDIIFDSFSMK